MAKGSGRCGCSKCARRKRKKKIQSDLIVEMAQLAPQEEMPAVAEENKVRQVNELNEQEYSQIRDYRKLQQTDFSKRAWWTDMTHRVYMPPLMLQKPSSKPTRSECSSATSGFKSSREETPDLPSSSASAVSNTSDYKSVSQLDLRSMSSEEIPEKPKTNPELPAVRSTSQPLGHQPNPKPKELIELQMIASRRKRPVCRTTSHATDSFSNCVKCSKIVSKPFRRIKHQLSQNYCLPQ